MRGFVGALVVVVGVCAACTSERDPFSPVGTWVNREGGGSSAHYWDIRSDGACKRVVIEADGKTTCDTGNCVFEQGRVTRTVPLPGSSPLTQHTSVDSPRDGQLRFLPDLDNLIRIYDKGEIPTTACP